MLFVVWLLVQVYWKLQLFSQLVMFSILLMKCRLGMCLDFIVEDDILVVFMLFRVILVVWQFLVLLVISGNVFSSCVVWCSIGLFSWCMGWLGSQCLYSCCVSCFGSILFSIVCSLVVGWLCFIWCSYLFVFWFGNRFSFSVLLGCQNEEICRMVGLFML